MFSFKIQDQIRKQRQEKEGRVSAKVVALLSGITAEYVYFFSTEDMGKKILVLVPMDRVMTREEIKELQSRGYKREGRIDSERKSEIIRENESMHYEADYVVIEEFFK